MKRSNSQNRLLPVIFTFVLLVAVGIIVRLNPTPQTTPHDTTRTKAAAVTRLYFTPTSPAATPLQKQVGDTISLDLMLDPGTNVVSFAKFQIQYDATKLSVSGANALVVNSQAFPLTIEGPVASSGLIAAAVGIGSDPTKGITTPTKIATLTFTATQNSGAPTEVKYTSISQILSIGAGDKASDNVLGTTESAFIVIGQQTATLAPTQPGTNPTDSTNPSPTSDTGNPSPTSSTNPTAIPQPTDNPDGPTPTLGPHGFRVVFQLLFHGIGSAGDNPNPNNSSLSNKNPIHQEVPLNVQIVNSDNEIVATKIVTAFYNADQGVYFSHVDIPDTLPANEYVIKVKADKYLRKLMPGFFTINPGQTTTVPQTQFVGGDVNGDNQLNILDYNVLYDCGYGALDARPIVDPKSVFHSTVCQAHTEKDNADTNDDGKISATDYNLFIRELSVQVGE
jgi:hypothetical protein